LSLSAAPLLAALPLAPALADSSITLPPISIGAGLRTSFTSTNSDDPNTQDANDFNLDSIRLYMTGSVFSNLKLTFNTEYTGSPPAGDNKIQVMDAIARFEYAPEFNIWAGRFLPPSDRSNLYGPYYANNWAVYSDGVQDGYPMVAVGRDNGLAYWGDFGNLKVSVGGFDTSGTEGKSDVVGAARIQYDFWDAEPGYFLNGTYYGEKDILAVGAAGQTTSNHTAYSADVLMEKKVGDGGMFGIESEYTFYNGLGGYDGNYMKSKGWYALADYLFGPKIGIGQFQLLGKYAYARYENGSATDTTVTPPVTVMLGDYSQKTTEVDINYVIKSFNARVSLFYKGTDYSDSGPYDNSQIGLGLQIQI
jgi:hypothetical protein